MSRKGFGGFKIFLFILTLVVVIAGIYIVTDMANYEDIVNVYYKVGTSRNSNSAGMKKLNFLSTYVKQTGDFSIAREKGYTDSDLKPNSGKEEDVPSQDNTSNDFSGNSGFNVTGNGVMWNATTNFRMIDKPQKDIQIGSSGKYVGNVGCAITSLFNIRIWEGNVDSKVFENATKNPNNFLGAGVYWDRFLSEIGSKYRVAKKGAKLNIEDLCSRLDSGVPTLIHYAGKVAYYKGDGHYVFPIGYKKEGSDVIITIMDSAKRNLMEVSANELVQAGHVTMMLFK